METITPEKAENQQEEDGLMPGMEDAIDILMKAYEPVTDPKEAEIYFSTNEIIQAIEEHYGLPQGDPAFHQPIAGTKVVQKLGRLGFVYINPGRLQLQWIMKKRIV